MASGSPLVVTLTHARPPQDPFVGQEEIVRDATLLTNRSARPWRPVARRAHETEWQSITLVTNPITQGDRAVTNSHTELATSLNYRDSPDEQW